MSGGGPNGGGMGGIGAYMAQGQPASGFAPGVGGLGGSPVPTSWSPGGGFGVTPGAGLGPYMGGLEKYGLLLNNPQILNALRGLMGGGMAGGGGMSTGGPFRHLA